jgi:hypothetical protein
VAIKSNIPYNDVQIEEMIVETKEERAELIKEDFLKFMKKWNLDCACDNNQVVIGWYSQFTSAGERSCEAGELVFDYCDLRGFNYCEVKP